MYFCLYGYRYIKQTNNKKKTKNKKTGGSEGVSLSFVRNKKRPCQEGETPLRKRACLGKHAYFLCDMTGPLSAQSPVFGTQFIP